jgi:hypothetical protein
MIKKSQKDYRIEVLNGDGQPTILEAKLNLNEAVYWTNRINNLNEQAYVTLALSKQTEQANDTEGTIEWTEIE